MDNLTASEGILTAALEQLQGYGITTAIEKREIKLRKTFADAIVRLGYGGQELTYAVELKRGLRPEGPREGLLLGEGQDVLGLGSHDEQRRGAADVPGGLAVRETARYVGRQLGQLRLEGGVGGARQSDQGGRHGA